APRRLSVRRATRKWCASRPRVSNMPTELPELLGDPLFQLNTLLWLAQPLPAGAEIAPLLHRQGFTVYAVAPHLPLPPDLQLSAQEAGLRVQPGTRPDVVLTHAATNRYAFVECKRSSFGPSTTTATQALTLIVLSGPRSADIMAVPVTEALSAFLVPDSQRELLANTLCVLSQELTAAGIAPGVAAVMA